MTVTRANWYLHIGDGRDEWVFPDPRDKRVEEAQRGVRYGTPTLADARVLDSVTTALDYLLYVCPSTKDACAKLREMRRAVRLNVDEAPPHPRETRAPLTKEGET